MTYFDAIAPTARPREGVADAETAGTTSFEDGAFEAGFPQEKKNENVTNDDEAEDARASSARAREKGERVYLATARAASARFVSGWRFSGNADAAAAGVAPARTVTCDGARCRWDPDAHFALLRVRAAWARMAEQRARRAQRRYPGNDPGGTKSNGADEDSPFSGNSGREPRGLSLIHL